ncbi:hypothetical protein CRG98_031113, partial [Punica granatum]
VRRGQGRSGIIQCCSVSQRGRLGAQFEDRVGAESEGVESGGELGGGSGAEPRGQTNYGSPGAVESAERKVRAWMCLRRSQQSHGGGQVKGIVRGSATQSACIDRYGCIYMSVRGRQSREKMDGMKDDERRWRWRGGLVSVNTWKGCRERDLT